MTTTVSDHRGPHVEILKLLHSAAGEGATRATVQIMPDRLEYQDDRSRQATIDTSHIEPDGHYTIEWAIEKYPIQDSLHVHFINHMPWGKSAHGEGHTHLPHQDDNDVTPPRDTPSGRYRVRLKTGAGRPGEVMILDNQGLPVPRADHFGLQTVYVQTGMPGDKLQRRTYSVLATPVPGREMITPTNGKDREDIIDTAQRMFADLVRETSGPPRTGMLWPDRRTRDMLDELGLNPGVDPEPTARLYPEGVWENPRILMPPDPVWAQLPHTSGPWILRALRKHPQQQRHYTLIENPSHADLTTLPVLRLSAVTAVETNGAVTTYPIPDIHPDLGAAMTHEPRIDNTVMDRVNSITATLEYRDPGKPPDRFDVELDAYSDSDNTNHIILTTTRIDMDPATFLKTSGIRFYRTTGAFTGPWEWTPQYHARRLTQANTQEANQEVLATIAEALDTIGIRPTAKETTVTSPSGTIKITIQAEQKTPS